MKELELLQAYVETILPQNELGQKLKQYQTENRILVIKLGFDPTASDWHLRHAVVWI